MLLVVLEGDDGGYRDETSDDHVHLDDVVSDGDGSDLLSHHLQIYWLSPGNSRDWYRLMRVCDLDLLAMTFAQLWVSRDTRGTRSKSDRIP